jgi:hypothetical protein
MLHYSPNKPSATGFFTQTKINPKNHMFYAIS